MDAVLDVDWAAHWRRLVEEREAQIELEPEGEGFEQVRPGRARERLVKHRPKSTAKCREYGEVDRGQRENETSESWESIEHFRGGFRRLAPMSRTAI